MVSSVLATWCLKCLWTARLVSHLAAGYFSLQMGGPVWAGTGDAGISHSLEVPETLRCVGVLPKVKRGQKLHSGGSRLIVSRATEVWPDDSQAGSAALGRKEVIRY